MASKPGLLTDLPWKKLGSFKLTYIDFMNNMGHCNFEMVPNKLFSIFPPFKYLMYTPTFHSLHHTQFRTNYSLFMPFYDYIYATTDESTDTLHEASLKRLEDSPDRRSPSHTSNVYARFHLSSTARVSLRCFEASHVQMVSTTNVARHTLLHGIDFHMMPYNHFREEYLSKSQTTYLLRWKRKNINHLIEEAILDAEARGVKVFNSRSHEPGKFIGKELNRNGEVYIERYPKPKVKVVDRSSLATAIVINTYSKRNKTSPHWRKNLQNFLCKCLCFVSKRDPVEVEATSSTFGDRNNRCEKWWWSHSSESLIQIGNPLQEKIGRPWPRVHSTRIELLQRRVCLLKAQIITYVTPSAVHPFLELGAYFVLFAIPLMTTVLTSTASLVGLFDYVTYIDFMNMMGHCNFEMVPNKLFSIFPPLKYLMYTPTLDSLSSPSAAAPFSLLLPYPKLKLKVADGSSLAAAIVINTIPKGTKEVLIRGKISCNCLCFVSKGYRDKPARPESGHSRPIIRTPPPPPTTTGVNPPGGVWQDERNGHKAGTAIYADRELLNIEQ
ncbi:hypothetical protein LguiA_010203 [Lonicera macranthoides]